MISEKEHSRTTANGKFFRRLDRKFFFKALRLEPCAGELDFNQKLALRGRFEELSRAHTTGLIVPAAQGEACLGVAAAAGLTAIVELAVAAEELADGAASRTAASRLAQTVVQLRGYPSVMGYLVRCPIDADALRHRGLLRAKQRLRTVLRAIRQADPNRLIGLNHQTATIGLSSLDEDFIYAQMPTLTPAELQDYVVRLHNLAESRPVVLEFGEELPGQDEMVACAFGLGAAGVVAPVMRPVASPGWLGLRTLSAGELLPFVSLNGSCPPQPSAPPMVSVVICAYNAERTMRACLESLRTIDYPNYEVVIVDDGSRDTTAEIAADFPEFRLIRQPNKGLSVARNVGMRAAHGELIAYTDSDCVVDPHWLTLMVRAMQTGGFEGCGGPNYAPP